MTDLLAGSTVRGLFMGSGGGMAEPGMAELVLELTGREAASLERLYLGSCTRWSMGEWRSCSFRGRADSWTS